MTKKILIGVCTGALAFTMACSKSATPVSPGAAELASTAAAPDGSTLKVGAPTLTSPANSFIYPPGSQPPVVFTLTNVNGTYTTFTVTYELELRNAAGTVISNPKFTAQAGATTSFTNTATLAADTPYTWRARATYNGAFGPWSSTFSFRTALLAGLFVTPSGGLVLDPLTNGKTVGVQRGGQFIPGQGWQSLTNTDSIDYDVATCSNCTIEFDVTNVGPQEGLAVMADLKFLSMGEASSFADFGSFRDGPWKMHLIQRADTDGLEIVWRNGGTNPDGNPGDHRIKMTCCGPTFKDANVTHFKLVWNSSGYSISAGTNGGPLEEYMSDGFGGIPYAPPNQRISFGCYPRGESFVGAIFRNFSLTPNK